MRSLNSLFYFFISLVVLSILLPGIIFGQSKKAFARLAAFQSDFTPDSAAININNMSLRIYATGRTGNHPNGAQSVTFPRGTANVVYLDGFVWGGKVQDGASPEIRVGGHTWLPGTVPGSIIAPGVAEDFNDPAVNRVWRVRRDYFKADLRDDAAHLFLKSPGEMTAAEISTLRERYARDWLEWPWQKGAPFYDAASDGVYTPRFNADGSPQLYPEADEPGLAAADQVVWLVINDLDEQHVLDLYGSPPIGIETQITLWAYHRNEALNNIIFKRYRLIYKGTSNIPATARIDSMHIAQWSDPDLGFFADDLVGCDTLLNMGYVYNWTTDDSEFRKFNLPAPAFGYDLLGGPLVPDPGGEAVFDLHRVMDFKHLRMTHFSFTAAGDPYNEPILGGLYRGTLQWWNVLRGFLAYPENQQILWSDNTGRPTRYVFSGDPVVGVGMVESRPGERFLYITSGPFDLALGDTNEVTLALVGGPGSDRLTSITVMKYYDRIAQHYFDNLFNVPRPPAAPKLFATEFDGNILLNWGKDPAAAEQVERSLGDYRFEGYNIYQLPSATAAIAEGVRLATFDVENGVRAIVQERFDISSGVILKEAVQFGADSGIRRTFHVRRDTLHGEPLYNGQTYYFAVSAYNYNPDTSAAVKSLEGAPAVVTVVPQSFQPGLRVSARSGDTLAVMHEAGPSFGSVVPLVVDPTQITGDDYRVVFSLDQNEQTVWHLLNTTSGDTVLKNQTNQTGDDSYFITEGLQVKVVGSSADYARVEKGDPAFIEVANENGPLSDVEYDAAGAPFGGNLVWHSLNWQGSQDRYFLSTTTSDESGLRTNFSALVPFDYELRFTSLADGSWGWWAFTTGNSARVPFQLWNVGQATFDDPLDDIRLIPILFEGGGTPDAYTPDRGVEEAFGFPAFDGIYWYNPLVGETYADYEADAMDGSVDVEHRGDEIMARLLVADFDDDGLPPRPGSIIRIFSTKPNAPQDVFTFSTAGFAPTFSLETARVDIERINVVPNPYYGPFNLSDRFAKGFVTFTHLPEAATIRIFTLAGNMVRRLEKSDPGQFLQWDLKNAQDKYVGNGIYIAHVEMQELQVNKVLRLVVFPN